MFLLLATLAAAEEPGADIVAFNARLAQGFTRIDKGRPIARAFKGWEPADATGEDLSGLAEAYRAYGAPAPDGRVIALVFDALTDGEPTQAALLMMLPQDGRLLMLHGELRSPMSDFPASQWVANRRPPAGAGALDADVAALVARLTGEGCATLPLAGPADVPAALDNGQLRRRMEETAGSWPGVCASFAGQDLHLRGGALFQTLAPEGDGKRGAAGALWTRDGERWALALEPPRPL